jgi:7,8-dihydropterin-6-yl-methyl-4-(beta-D-ribofuranosyl)aminobenzene 5'-phosphate synthase
VNRTEVFLLAGALLGAAVVSSGVATAQIMTAAVAQPESQASSSQRDAAKDHITVLYDAFGRDPSMTKDWGFSALIEVRGKRILFDTGNNSEVFAHNIKAKGVDLTTLDFVVMSHRHGDHMGGLNYLLSVNPNVTIYAPKENFGVFGSSLPGTFYRRNEALPRDMRYFDGEPPETLYFGTPWPQGKFTWISKSIEVASGFHLIVLKGSWGVDLDVMEISLAIDTPEGAVLVVGCSHPTIERIVEATKAAMNEPIHLIVGGLHLLPAKDEETQRIGTALRDTWKVAWIAPAHCTGEPAFAILKKIFGDRYLYAGLGTTVALNFNPIAGAAEHGSNVFFDNADWRPIAKSLASARTPQSTN